MKFFVVLAILFSLNVLAGFDHSHKHWSYILINYTKKDDKQVNFNYKNLKNNREDLDKYLDELEQLKEEEFETFNESQKLAFWINAYNAYTIQIIIDNYPVKSIKDISSGFFSSGPWKKDFIQLFGQKMSLDNIEHDTIRKKFKEARIHFAVNCASVGCPSLLQEAFVSEKLSDQLDFAAKNFLQNTSKNFVKGNTLYLSRIFKWYGDDFKEKYGSYQKYIIKKLNLPGVDYKVVFNDYDWRLNEVR